MNIEEALDWADGTRKDDTLPLADILVMETLAAEVRRLREFVKQEETAADGWQKRAEAAESALAECQRKAEAFDFIANKTTGVNLHGRGWTIRGTFRFYSTLLAAIEAAKDAP